MIARTSVLLLLASLAFSAKADVWKDIEKRDLAALKADIPALTAAAKNKDGMSPLDAALTEGWDEGALALIEAGMYINTPSPVYGLLPLMRAIISMPLVNSLIQHGADLEARDEGGRTALAESVVLPHTDLMVPPEKEAPKVEALLKAGARPNVVDSQGQTPLMIASHEGNAPAIKLLLAYGADTRIRDSEGATAIDYAADGADQDSIDLLVGAGAHMGLMQALEMHNGRLAEKLNAAREPLIPLKNRDPFQLAMLSDSLILVKKYCPPGKIGDLLDKNGNPWIFCALDAALPSEASPERLKSHPNSVAILLVLLHAGADPNAIRKSNPMAEWGDTPLLVAVMKKRCDIAKVLLQAGAKVNPPFGNLPAISGSDYPYQAAVDLGDKEMAQLLKSYGGLPMKETNSKSPR